jgi:hypothetical protein
VATEYGLGVVVERSRSPSLKREESPPFGTCISSRVPGATSAGSHSTPVTPQISTWDGAIVGLKRVNCPICFQDLGSELSHQTLFGTAVPQCDIV